MKKKRILVFSSLFPSSKRPFAGLFIRQRMFRVAGKTDLSVVSPVPWFPGQGLIRLFKPDYRPMPGPQETQDGIPVSYPRFFSFPGLFRQMDARMMARACLPVIEQLHHQEKIDVIDSHFTYPDGLAATLIGRRLGIKVMITLRGTEFPHSRDKERLPLLRRAWQDADHLVTVSSSLKQLAVSLGTDEAKVTVVGNGVDHRVFHPVDREEARRQLGIDPAAKVLITVGGLVRRKGFHRVLKCIPDLAGEFPDLRYIIAGGASAEGDEEAYLRRLAKELDIERHVVFTGPVPPEKLKSPLSAADLFVLASSNEGWANVILESMACGTPVLATDVGGNAEVVCSENLGAIVPFQDRTALTKGLRRGLEKRWDRREIISYAEENHWDRRVAQLTDIYDRLTQNG
ncbi:MAG: glycosyltransferase [Desulfobacterales bacterium]|nr:glycosyltransferase [Desulfobacterales bacterium]